MSKLKSPATININGVTAAEFADRWTNFSVRNDGEDTIYVSAFDPECTVDGEGVYSVPAGGACVVDQVYGSNTLYFNGSGKAFVKGQSHGFISFKSTPKGGDSGGTVKQTPLSLGYVDADCQMFFDGIYNNKYLHDSYLSTVWLDLCENEILKRSNGAVAQIGYIKNTSDSSSTFSTSRSVQYNTFTCEILCKILYIADGECDICSNFRNSSGFGIYIENQIFKADINDGSGYVGIHKNLSEIKSGINLFQITYDGSTFRLYINGELDGSIPVSTYRKSNDSFGVGGCGNGNYSGGQYEFYRFAMYDRALTLSEISQNYARDVLRYDV